jgi:hypothetical protein
MTQKRRFVRWLPTFLAFPLGGLAAITLVGATATPATGLATGAILGAIVGGAQWLALRSSGVGPAWWLATTLATAVATALTLLVVGSGTTTSDLMLRGAITGLAVGASQAIVLRTTWTRRVAWTAVTAAAWAGAWLITLQVIVDPERGYVGFGASGALAATVLTGLALAVVLGPRQGTGPALEAPAVTA